MKLLSLNRKSIPKLAVLVTGLIAAIVAATVSPQAAQATPRAADCAGCHSNAAGTTSTVTATPSTATPAPGASYTVAITMTANPTGGFTGYGIVAIAPTPAPLVRVFGGNTGSQLAFTATMIAPAAAGTYSYTVYTNQGPTSDGQTGSKVYSITVAPAPVAVTTTTALAMVPTAATAVAPAAKTLNATVTGAGAAGTVQFFNGTTSLGSSPVAAGGATLALTAIAEGSYSYHAVFTPTNAALFTSSTSASLAFTVTAAPPVQVTTTTALTMAPTAATAVAPAAKTLNATVTGLNAAGTVQFFNGTTSLGTSAVAAGAATLALSAIPAGVYSYHAVFTPTNAALFTTSTSANLAFTVTVPVPVQVTTTTALAMFPAAITDVAPATKTLTATVTGLNAAGTVEFFNGATSLGTSPVAAGIANKTLNGIAAGSYSYHAVFTPTDGALFTSSTSGNLAFTVTVPVPVQVTTTTVLAMSPTDATAVAPAAKTLNATVAGLNAAGTVQFFNGTTSLGTSAIDAAGIASKALTGIVAGSYSYHAVFTPTDAALFTSSTSGNLAFTVTAAPPVQVTTTTALTMAPTAVTAVAPAAKTLTATVTGANAAGTVQFFNGTTSLGTSPVTAGNATLALTAIAVGSYSYNAVFTPTNAALFTSSTSGNLAFTVTAAPPVQVTTTTALAMSPTAATAVAPAAKTLNATVSGLNAAGMMEFFDGTTSLGTSPVGSAGIASKVLTGIVAGSYSYSAVFTPTDAALFTSSTSGNLAFTVTAIPVVTAPVASFTAVTTLLTAALTDTSTNAPTSWLWDLGNGTTSTVKSPSVTYAAAGTYTVVLTATNSAGSSTATKTITVTAPTGASAAHISRISPDEASVGTKVTITGTGFGTAGVVKFGTVTATVVSYTDTSIVVTVPAVYREEVRVTVTPTGGTASNGVEFEVNGSHYGDWGHSLSLD